MPELLRFVEAELPPGVEPGVEGTHVQLKLTIDPQGNVASAEIVESAGEPFDGAALAAAQRFVFEPARRGEAAVAARVLYDYEFPPPRARVPEETVAPEGAPAPVAPPAGGALASTASPIEEVEVSVRGQSVAERLRRSAEAVTVVEVEEAKRQSADLGTVLARTEGVEVRRGGGLGSEARFTLNGLSGDQVRFFLDGVPLEHAGYPLGVSTVPVNLVERVEIYRGVVPVRLGADALGGAVNLVTPQDLRGTHGYATYQFGSLHTWRLAAGARSLHEPTGIFVRAEGFHDSAKNDYPVDVQVADERGQLTPVRVRRFHDSYQASGGSFEVGIVDKPWARRLLLRAFVTDYDRDLQNNRNMSRVYGEITEGQTRGGATLRYENNLGRGVHLEAIGSYSQGDADFVDVSRCAYNWYGRCVRERPQGGEMDGRPYDRLVTQRSVFSRVNLGWRPHHEHGLRLSLTPTSVSRVGQERSNLPGAGRDPYGGENQLLTLVSGFEYEADLFEDRLENIAFVKDYLQAQRAEEPLPNGNWARRDRETHQFGVGDALRYRFTDEIFGKISYELATRLPRPEELFGDAVLILPNLELAPESSHNVNAGLAAARLPSAVGEFRFELTGYLREVSQLIVLLGGARDSRYQNMLDARILGVTGAVGWSSRGDVLALDANLTGQDARNGSREGTFRGFEGDRIPNLPYLYGNAFARVRFKDLADPKDELLLFWNLRYVHEFFLSWESIGSADSKAVVETQLVQTLALTYLFRWSSASLSTTLEAQNLTDEKTQDFYGVQKPGRAFFFKSVLEM